MDPQIFDAEDESSSDEEQSEAEVVEYNTDMSFSNSDLNSREKKPAKPVILYESVPLFDDEELFDAWVERDESKHPDWCFLCFYSQTQAETQTNTVYLALKNFLYNNYGRLSRFNLAKVTQAIYNSKCRGKLLKPDFAKNSFKLTKKRNHEEMSSGSSNLNMEEENYEGYSSNCFVNRPWYLKSIIKHVESHNITAEIVLERSLRVYTQIQKVLTDTGIARKDTGTGKVNIDEKGARLYMQITKEANILARQQAAARDPRIV